MQVTDETYKKYSQMVYRYLLSVTRDAAVAEELTQETFYQAVKSVKRFDGTCRFSTWLCAIARNQLSNYRRKHLQIDCYEETDSSQSSRTDTQTPEQAVISEYEQMAIMKKLHAIEDPAREIMYLRIFGNLTFAQIGEVVGRTENWARVTYYRGKEKLRKELDGDA